MNNHPILLERLFDAPASKVWKALTDKNEMKQWYFDLEEFEAVPGFTFQFKGGPSPDKQYLHLCEITEVIPGKKLTYSWRYDGYPGKSFVTFELFEKENKTVLRLTHSGIETFAKENSDFGMHNFEKGWNAIINTSLKEYLEK
ncbi:MAG: SRPBCC domain-containing protein [Bacteroidota bacterium]|nr:SRPBCC domain-containing protein [Bacteroidota bacterium]